MSLSLLLHQCSSNFVGFRDGWLVAVQVLFCWTLLPGFVRSILVQFPSNFIYIYIYVCVCVCVCVCITWLTACTDLPDLLPLLTSIVHRSRQIFDATSCIGTELL